jgi:hypothetical protein
MNKLTADSVILFVENSFYFLNHLTPCDHGNERFL